MQLRSLDEMKDELLGKVGTKRRDDYELSVEEALHAYRIGVKRAQIFRIKRI